MDNLLDFDRQKKELLENTKSSRELISKLLDDSSFVETDAFLFTRNDLADSRTFGEGVVTGYGTVGGSPVYIFCQNYGVLKGGLGKAHADKILKCMKMAEKTGSPLISVLHTAGARLGEGITALEGYGEIIAQSVKMSGTVPQIAVVNGECFGQMSCLAALSDFVFMTNESAVLLGAPQVVAAKSNSLASPVQIGGAEGAAKYGLTSFHVKSTSELKNKLSQLLALLVTAEIDADEAELNRTVKFTAKADMKKAAAELFDKGSMLEIGEKAAPRLLTALGRLGGCTVGVIANCYEEGKEYLTGGECRKAARFIRMLDCFEIPFVSLVNCQGAESGVEAEQAGLVKDTAALMYAIGEAGVPKLSVIVSAAGVGYSAFASKNLGFDYVLALDTARISTLSSATGAEIVYADEIAKAKNSDATREKVEKRYGEYDANPYWAAEQGAVDNIVPASGVRKYLISALQMLRDKEAPFPEKRHGNMPF